MGCVSIPIPGNRRTMENDICRKLRLAALVIGGLSVVIRSVSIRSMLDDIQKALSSTIHISLTGYCLATRLDTKQVGRGGKVPY